MIKFKLNHFKNTYVRTYLLKIINFSSQAMKFLSVPVKADLWLFKISTDQFVRYNNAVY